MIRLFTISLTLHALCAPLCAQRIIGIGGGGDVNAFDPQTGATSVIGSSGVIYGIWTALAQDSQGRLFAANGYWNLPYRIYEIDPQTGNATLAAQTTLIGVGALAFGPGDVLYAANDPTAPLAHGPFDLHSVNLVDGSDSLIGTTDLYILTSMDSQNGTMWGYDGNLGLVTIDMGNAAAIDVNPSFRGPLDLAESICFGPDGQLFQMDAGLWIMDTLTGVPCLVGFTGYLGFIAGIEYLPDTTPPFTLGTVGLTGGPMGLEIWGATPNSTVAFLRASGGGGPTSVSSGYPCAGTLLDLNAGLQLATIATTDSQGHLRLGPARVPAAAAGSLRLQALDFGTCRTSNLARVIY